MVNWRNDLCDRESVGLKKYLYVFCPLLACRWIERQLGQVQAYIAAMPGWKSDVGHRLDTLIARTVPGVRRAVKWNSPFYGIEGRGFSLGLHCFTKYIKLAFFRGTSLRPVPPIESKQKEARYFHIHEDDPFDEELVASWIRQASELPGWVP